MSDTSSEPQYPIGTPGVPWGAEEKAAWRDAQVIKRSYDQEVRERIMPLASIFELHQYGELNYEAGTYPLCGLTSRDWDASKPTILVTGGVHGYETSGVQGAIRFVAQHARSFTDTFNIVAAPCISPWGYETVNRWNPDCIDPNRSFYADSPAAESAQVMQWVRSVSQNYLAHFDLHETTDTDDSEFRPALAARDGKHMDNHGIPDGFYLVDDAKSPQPEFQRAMIAEVAQVTHIAPPDDSGLIIGSPVVQEGVIEYDLTSLGLCAGMTNARYRTTTEVYPDSPQVDDENCILAQVAAVRGGLNYLRATL